MKNLFISSVLFLSAVSASASALDRSFFECTADRLAAYNSSIYYGITKDELVDILDDSNDGRSRDVITAAKTCLDEALTQK